MLEGVEAAAEHVDGDFGHARDVDVGLQRRLVREHDGDFGDALGVVAHALEVDDDVQYCQDACAGRRAMRLLRSEELEALLLGLVALAVDLHVVDDDDAGELDVAVTAALRSSAR